MSNGKELSYQRVLRGEKPTPLDIPTTPEAVSSELNFHRAIREFEPIAEIYIPGTERHTFFEAFGEGFKEELLRPLQIFGVETLETETDRPMAELLGQIVGMGVGFLPFLAAGAVGAAALAPRVGLAASTIVTRPVLFNALRGGLGFGLYEAGSAESVSEAPAKFARGAAIGAAFDMVFFAKAVQNRSMAEKISVSLAKKSKGRKIVNAQALTIESVAEPELWTKNPMRMAEALAEIGDEQTQLLHSSIKLQFAFEAGGGSFRLQGLTDRKSVEAAIKKLMPGRVDISPHKDANGLWNLYLTDKGKARPRIIGIFESMRKPKVKELGEPGLPVIRNPKDFAELVRTTGPFESSFTLGDMGVLPIADETMAGIFRWESADMVRFVNENELLNKPLGTIFTASDMPDLIMMENMVHELGHRFVTVLGVESVAKEIKAANPGARIGIRIKDKIFSTTNPAGTPVMISERETLELLNLSDVIDLDTIPWSKVFGITKDAAAFDKKVQEELMAVMERNMSKVFLVDRRELKELIALDLAKNKSDKYLTGNQELFSRFMSQVYLDPKSAKEGAPTLWPHFVRLADEQMPALRWLLSKGEEVNALQLLEANLKDISPRLFRTRVFSGTERVFTPTKEMKELFAKTNIMMGERVRVGGAYHISLRPTNGHVLVQNITTGRVNPVPYSSLEFETIPEVLLGADKLLSKMTASLLRPPRWFGVLLKDTESGGTRKAVVELEGYELVRGGKEGLAKWVKANTPRSPHGDMVSPDMRAQQQVLEAAKRQGLHGVISEDEGLFKLYIADRSSVKMTDDVVYSGLYGEPDGRLLDDVIDISFDNATASLLREAGASEEQLPFLVNRAREKLGRDLLKLVDQDVLDVLVSAEREIWTTPRGVFDDITEAAATRSLEVTETSGSWIVRDAVNKKVVSTFDTKVGAEQYVAAVHRMGTDIGGMTNAFNFNLGMGKRRPFNDTELANPMPEETLEGGWLSRMLDSVSFMAPWFTPKENFAKAAQRRGYGELYDTVFDPLQRGLGMVDYEWVEPGRAFLGGDTMGNFMRKFQDLARKIKGKRSEKYILSRDWLEFTTKNELEAGHLLGEMNEAVLDFGQRLMDFGLESDVPRLVATLEGAKLAIKNKKNFDKVLRRALNDPKRHKPEELELLKRVEAQYARDIPETVAKLLDQMGLTPQEKIVLELMDTMVEAEGHDAAKFSIMAASLWARSPRLPEGFKTGRAWFAVQKKMSKEELEFAAAADRIMAGSLEEFTDLTGEQLFAFWGELRRWVDHGLHADSKSLGGKSLLSKYITKDLVKYADLRLKSGTVNIYDEDPILMAYKHVRSLLHDKHVNPYLPKARDALTDTRESGLPGAIRIANVMNEYVNDVIGVPHITFRRIQTAIETSARTLGHPAPDRFAEKWINGVVALGYTATIPFRPALIMRNYWQMFQMTPGRIGYRWFWAGLDEALTKEGYRAAVKAQAIPVGTVPIHASTEILGPGFGPEFMRMMPAKARRAFERGFDWYRKADDVGRATAFLGFKARAKHHMKDYMGNRITWEQFKSKAKINTFDSEDIRAFERLWNTDKEGALDHLGRVLARETHFRYGHANHPSGWGSVFGRVFGQFGTWPVQYKDYLLQGMARGSTKDKAQFLATHAATNMSMVAAGGAVGLNLWGWVAFPSLNYSGGPLADIAVDLMRVWNGSPMERSLAKRSLIMQFPTFDDPRSVFIPGSYFAGDIHTALTEGDNVLDTTMQALGFRFFEPGEKTALDFLYGGN